MFSYAFGRCLALRKGTGLRLSTWAFRNKRSGRRYSLGNLSLPDDIEIMPLFEGFLLRLGTWSVQKFCNLRKIKPNFFTDKYIYLTDFDRYEPELMRPDYGKENITVLGGFQTRKYFADYDSQIRKEFRVSVPPSTENAAMIRELSECESVCVHVRRGDYLSTRLDVCGYEYYSAAMRYIAGRVNNPVYYFFSNTHADIDWLKENWKFPGFNVKYVDLNNPDYEELRLMYSCRHFIIANSSFSWWGSYLSDNPVKIVCAPSEWSAEKHTEDTNVYLPEWIIIK